jgi:secreted Zn-dependent insulinase-like peptidase
VTSLDVDVYAGVQSPFRLVTFEYELSESGLANYKKVLAFVFEYLRKVKEEWLKDGKGLDCWTEQKTLS